MKEIKRYLYYSPIIDEKHPKCCQYYIDCEKRTKMLATAYLGKSLFITTPFYYIGEY